ncbi:hypothetical protein D1007_55193 [Hordeum vulgare]|nr:hypothetical protein D1007_55193 [Hordeum vulgare]
MDDDLEAAAAIASQASSAAVAEARGKAHVPYKTVVPSKKKKELTPEERAVELAKRKGRRHAQDARGEVDVAAAIATADTNARVKATTREALLYLGVNPGHHGLVNAVVAAAAASTGSSPYPRMMLPESPRVFHAADSWLSRPPASSGNARQR